MVKYDFLNKRKNLCALIFSLLFSIFFFLGKAIYQTNDISSFFQNTVPYLISIIVMTTVLSIVVVVVYGFPFTDSISPIKYKKIYFYILWILFFVSWVPAFIAYYPGIWSYDIGVQIWQTAGNYNTYHPPLQTFILDLFIRLSQHDYAKAISLYAICQMLLLSSVFSYTVCYLIRQKYSRLLIVASVLFYSLNPVIAIFSTIPVKDVLCGAILVLVVLDTINMVSDPNSYFSSLKSILSHSVFVLLFCLLRNNAIYAVIVALPFYLFIKTRKHLFLVITLLIPIVLYFFSTTFIYPMLGIEKSRGSEMFSVPLQQISNVVVHSEDTLTQTDKEIIDCFLPYNQLPEIYNPRFADPVRFVYNGDQGPVFMLKEWLHLLPTHLKEYINAFISLNLPMWYPDANAKDPFSGAQYIETNITYHNVGAPFENAGLCPVLLNFYESVATYYLFESLPQVLNVFTLSFALWFMMFSSFKLISIKKSEYLVSLCVPFFFWATYLLCPVSSMRYILPLVMIYPVILSFLFMTPSKEMHDD